jgi:hypothetical protein
MASDWLALGGVAIGALTTYAAQIFDTRRSRADRIAGYLREDQVRWRDDRRRVFEEWLSSAHQLMVLLGSLAAARALPHLGVRAVGDPMAESRILISTLGQQSAALELLASPEVSTNVSAFLGDAMSYQFNEDLEALKRCNTDLALAKEAMRHQLGIND